MALLLHSSPSSSLTATASTAAAKKTNHLHHLTRPHFHRPSRPPLFSIRSQDPSSQDTTSSTTGQGFSSTGDDRPETSTTTTTNKKKKQKGKRERAPVIRRAPMEKPMFFASEKEEAVAKEQSQNESAFLLAWLGLGGIIFVQGITLAASCFLPEEWDDFFVKYLYPSFTPTVFLFVAGTVAYGVSKYLQNEKFNSEK